MRNLLRRLAGRAFLRFVLVGTVNTGVDVVIYTVLVATGLPVVVANLISTTCGLIVSYVLNRTFVFRDGPHPHRRARIRQLVLFVVTTGFGLWVLQPLVILAGTAALRPLAVAGLVLILVPKLAATAVTLVWNYVLYSLVVFAGARPAAVVTADLALGTPEAEASATMNTRTRRATRAGPDPSTVVLKRRRPRRRAT